MPTRKMLLPCSEEAPQNGTALVYKEHKKVFLTSRNGTNDLLKVNLYLHLVWTGAASELLGCKGVRIRN
ncbi:hypothetical protein R1flu_016635 [Riccia fluitans]|uniref:Uncharacterized protein n=1 Tax=Riccia fluitans TaxID=41844 RepID=A0ABD1YNE2_9MARC